MGFRHAISDADWDRVGHLLSGQPRPHGGAAAYNLRFLDAVLRIARTGAAWRDLPERLGNWNSQWRRFDRWAEAGRFAALRNPSLDVLILGATVTRARQCAAGSKKRGTGPAARAIKRSAASAAGSGPRATGVSTASASRPNCS
jgi:transposase